MSKDKKVSSILTGVAGEYFAAAELSRRGYVASITLRNTKGIDIIATNEEGSKTINIQVKTSGLKTRGWILNKKGAGFFANELLERVGLVERKDNFPSQLSGGEKARVALVRALINKPRLILADEPTGNLDQKNALKLIDLLMEINENYRQSIVLTTHNPEVASIGNQKLILKNGKLIKRDE